ncbi:3-keto-disaccharide hydrolase [Membranihabitans marinus]|uniref:3-keto-disaccharide hydrolase n=1 Tax=Membranihabitans marinus TaxID=1227546 RepID=UPI001F32434C|nr:DUF1080 domain-containing protein [Membranihabitans marinus]
MKRLNNLMWLLLTCIALVSACKSSDKASEDGYVSIFNGKNLDGWEGDPDYWTVENGNIVGTVTEEKPLENNTFLIWRKEEPADFELIAEFKITESGNSGIQYRSEELSDIKLALKGYQADIDGKNTYTGQNYEERGRAFLAKRGEISVLENGEKPSIVGSLGDGDELKTKIHKGDWNTIKLVVKGNRLQHYINGVMMSDVTDNDAQNRKMKGHLGFQVHKGPAMRVEYRNIQYKKL